MKHQEPDALKVARPVLRGGKPVRVYLSRQAYIEGPSLGSGAKVVVLEDVVTTGKSAMVAVERLRTAGYSVDRVIALVDREQGGAELYKSAGLEFQALFSLVEIKNKCINTII